MTFHLKNVFTNFMFILFIVLVTLLDTLISHDESTFGKYNSTSQLHALIACTPQAYFNYCFISDVCFYVWIILRKNFFLRYYNQQGQINRRMKVNHV